MFSWNLMIDMHPPYATGGAWTCFRSNISVYHVRLLFVLWTRRWAVVGDGHDGDDFGTALEAATPAPAQLYKLDPRANKSVHEAGPHVAPPSICPPRLRKRDCLRSQISEGERVNPLLGELHPARAQHRVEDEIRRRAPVGGRARGGDVQ